MNRKTIALLIGIPLVAMVGSAFLLSAIFGPTDNGLRCSRMAERAACDVLQARFFGLAGNSRFGISESTIRGAKALCATGKVGGRGSASCNVYLELESGQNYPVMSYALHQQADASAKRLNEYFEDKSASSIEIKEDLMTPILLSGVAPVAVVVLVLGLRRLGFRSGRPALERSAS
jgi:hypothetical protein